MWQFYGADILATILVVLAYWLLGNKNKYGYLASLASCLIWLGIGVYLNIWTLVVMNIFIAGFVLRGFFKWNKGK